MNKEEFVQRMMQEQRKKKIREAKKKQYEYSCYHKDILTRELKRR